MNNFINNKLNVYNLDNNNFQKKTKIMLILIASKIVKLYSIILLLYYTYIYTNFI